MVAQSWGGGSSSVRPAKGYIKTYSPKNSWGFIICDEVAKDVFFHMKNFTDCDPPEEAINAAKNYYRWEVEFDLDAADPEKPKAYQVRITSSAKADGWDYGSRGSGGGGGRDWDRDGGGDAVEDSTDIHRALKDLRKSVGEASSEAGWEKSWEKQPGRSWGKWRGQTWEKPWDKQWDKSRDWERDKEAEGGVSLKEEEVDETWGDWNDPNEAKPARHRRVLLDEEDEPVREEPRRETATLHEARSPLPRAKGAAPRRASASSREPLPRFRSRSPRSGEPPPRRIIDRRRTSLSPRPMRDRSRGSGYDRERGSRGGDRVRDSLREVSRGGDRGRDALRDVSRGGDRGRDALREASRGGDRGRDALREVSRGGDRGRDRSYCRGSRSRERRQRPVPPGDRARPSERRSLASSRRSELRRPRQNRRSAQRPASRSLLRRPRLDRRREQDTLANPAVELREGAIEHPASAKRPRSPPPPWELQEHPDAAGEWYYLNTETGATQWEWPGEPEEVPPDQAQANVENEAGDRPPAPPAPWKTVEHPDAPGEFYYYNEETGITCWELPEDEPR